MFFKFYLIIDIFEYALACRLSCDTFKYTAVLIVDKLNCTLPSFKVRSPALYLSSMCYQVHKSKLGLLGIEKRLLLDQVSIAVTKIMNLHNILMCLLFSRYNNDLELEDAIHTAILTLKVDYFQYLSHTNHSSLLMLFSFIIHYVHTFFVFQESFEGQMTEENIEVGICNEAGFKRLTPAEVKDYLAAIA